MSRRRRSVHNSESFSVRWQPVANIATPSADIMSSPDPLNDTADSTVMLPSSTRRVARSSQRSTRFSSFAPSPRKQTFELEVGDNQAPQRLLVTVETEDPSATSGPGSARRKLFQSPSLRQREMSTTTTIPLKNTIEDETNDPNATPKRRGRTRKSNGTPLPGAGTKRRAGTPIRRSPRRQKISKEAETAESTAMSTPGSKRRGRPPKNRAIEPPSELDIAATEGLSTREQRSRRRDPTQQEVVGVASETDQLPILRADESQPDNEMTLIITPSEAEAAQAPVQEPEQMPIEIAEDSADTSDAESDIWMATLDDEPTPMLANQVKEVPVSLHQNIESESEASEAGDDYGFLAPAGSDISSIDESPSESRPRNNDTVGQGEDFSMILMDSFPSLQADLRSSVHEVMENDIGEETSIIINNTLESLRRSLQQRDEPPRNQGTDDAHEAGEPVETPDASAYSLQRTKADDEEPPEESYHASVRPPLAFPPNRNMSPRWLRSPHRAGASPLRHQVLKMNAREDFVDLQNQSSNSQAPILDKQATVLRSSTDEGTNLYEDSFSEIPQDVLEAATPRRSRRVANTQAVEEVMEDVEIMDEEMQDEEDIQYDLPPQDEQDEQDEPPAASNTSAVSRSETGRLPTPDDTPPQIDAEADNHVKSAQAPQSSARIVSLRDGSPPTRSPRTFSVDHPQIPKIVEEFVEDAIEEVAEEVAGVVGETIEDAPEKIVEVAVEEDIEEELPTLVESQHLNLITDKQSRWPEVTPVNQLTSPLQEPQLLLPEMTQERARRPTLSPIVRAGRALQNVTSDPPSPEARDHHLRSPFRRSASMDMGPSSRDTQPNGRASASPRRPMAFPEVAQTLPDAGLYDDPFGADTRRTGQVSFMKALGRSGSTPAREIQQGHGGSASSSVRIDPPTEDEMSWVADEGPISDNLRGDVRLEDLAPPTTRSGPRQSEAGLRLDGIVDEVDEESEEADDDTDIWEFEAKRTSPGSVQKEAPEQRGTASPVYKRSALPSPWTKQTSRNSRQSTNLASQASDRGESERLLETHGIENEVPVTAQAEEYSLLAQREQGQQNQAPESTSKATRFDLSSFFSSPAAIPGMIAEKLLPVKNFSVFGSRSTQPEHVETEAVVSLPTSSMFPQVPQREFQPRPSSSHRASSSPVRREPTSGQREQVVETQPETAEPSKEIQMLLVAQKKNFAPRPRQPSQDFFRASTQSTIVQPEAELPPAAIQNGASTPPRMQLSHADIHKWQQQTSDAANEEPPQPSIPLLRPLPPRNASPRKSSLRSPLKPHTPGRVVEFTSSVLSPVEQAKARQQRRLSNSSVTSQTSAARRPILQMPPPQTADKENRRSLSASTANRSSLGKSTQREALSRTVWTRQHWLLLDELLQRRRQGPFELTYQHCADKFLGKTVKSHGEAMTLEKWHLDCVDAFKAQVGGWDEAALAKRLFALILGEERRRSQSVVGTPARVMFH